MAVEEPSELTILKSKYDKELEKWDHLRVDIGNLTIPGGPVHMSLRLDAITKILLEKGICTEDELNTVFLTTALDVLPRLRAEVEPVVTQARIDAIKNGRMH